jgi:hypothetical protein
MDELLERLERERRWTVALFLVAAAFIAAVQFALAPGVDEMALEPNSTVGDAP